MMPATVPAFTRIYTDAQRDALAHAYEDRRIKPARVVVELAANGELEWEGARLDPFTTNADTVRDLARELRKKRAGIVTSELANREPRDAIEVLRRRLINAADEMLKVQERIPAKARDPEQLRQIGRCVREFAALPGPKEARRPAPGTKHNGEREQGGTGGGLAGDLLAAHRTQTATSGKGRPLPNGATMEDDGHIGAQEAQAQEDETHEEGAEDGGHGSSARGVAHASLVPAA